jgi:hypothetical protein
MGPSPVLSSSGTGECQPQPRAFHLTLDSTSFPSHDSNPEKSASQCWMSSQERERFGETFHFADLNGDGVPELLIGAPRQGNNEEGGFFILSLAK